MSDIVEIASISLYGEILGFAPQHPLVSVVSLDEIPADRIGRKRFGFYGILFKEHFNGKISYGRGMYEYQADTMIFTSPSQVIGIDAEANNHSRGYFLMVHPDYLIDTSLADRIKEYFFFAYDVNEALKMSEEERLVIQSLFKSIRKELDSQEDKHTRRIVTSFIETMLNYCLRFYERQFAEQRTDLNNIMSRFRMILDEYYAIDRTGVPGLPTVSYCADKVNLSANYFGDLVKKETGKSAQYYIHSYIVDKAKLHLHATSMNINEIAYHLGFRYPHHFSRLFKRLTGMTPGEFKFAAAR